MRKTDKVQNEVTKTIEALGQLKQVEPPEGIYSAVMGRVKQEGQLGIDYAPYMRWAAIGLLVLMNTVSYISFLNYENTEVELFAESEIENLVSEYQISEFAYNEY